MKNDRRKKSERLYTSLGEMDPALVEAARAYRPSRKAVGYSMPRRIVAVALASVLLLTMAVLTVFAAVPSLRDLINLPFMKENARKDEVPEGWIGVYTVADLDRVRDDLGGKYILMNDLTFTEADGTFTPIGTMEEPFMGEFDGNGHVIRGLTIDVAQEDAPVLTGYDEDNEEKPFYTIHDVREGYYAGLFGYCGFTSVGSRDMHDLSFPYLIDHEPYRGMICNLGVENARILVRNASNARVGVIAGEASYVAGCYVKDCSVEVIGYESQAESATFYLRLGGIAGNAEVMDSCYAANCSLRVTGADDLLSDGRHMSGWLYEDGVRVEEMRRYMNLGNFDKATVFIGGLSGNVYTAVTSYTEGIEIACDYAANRQREWWWDDYPAYTDELFGHIHMLSNVMNASQFNLILEAFYRSAFDLSEDDPLPEDWKNITAQEDKRAFYFRKFQSYFILKTTDLMIQSYGFDPFYANPSLLTGDFVWENEMYLFDQAIWVQDILIVEDMAVEYIGEEKLAELIALENMKVGPYYCYTADPAQSYTEEDFAEFNFETIWEMKDGRPVLQLFE